MSSSVCGLLSATFHEDGYDHLVELVHQRDSDARRRLASIDVAVYGEDGERLGALAADPTQEVLDVAALARPFMRERRRAMIAFDARYEPRVFPYRPHHYGYLHRQGSMGPPLYSAVNAALGGVPARVGATGLNNFETYLFRGQTFAERYSVVVGNVSRFSVAHAEVFAYYGPDRTLHEITLPPKAHAEVEAAPERNGRRLERVEVKAVFRLASYVVGRRAARGDLVLFDHLFTYFR